MNFKDFINDYIRENTSNPLSTRKIQDNNDIYAISFKQKLSHFLVQKDIIVQNGVIYVSNVALLDIPHVRKNKLLQMVELINFQLISASHFSLNSYSQLKNNFLIITDDFDDESVKNILRFSLLNADTTFNRYSLPLLECIYSEKTPQLIMKEIQNV
jgi:hypothetical protein